MVRPTLCTTHRPGYSDVLSIPLLDDDIVDKVSVLRAEVYHDVLLRAGRRNTVLATKSSCSAQNCRRRRPLLLHLLMPFLPTTFSQDWWSTPTRALKSPRMINFFSFWHTCHKGIKFFIELVLYIVWVGHGRCVGTDDRGLFLSWGVSFMVIILSLIPWGRLLNLFTSSFLTAKPTPASRQSSLARPLQKNVKPAPVSLGCPSSASVSLRAAMSTLYLASSRPTSAVLLSGLFACALSSRVRTFHVPKMNGFILILCFLFIPLVWDPRQPRRAGQGR